MTDPTSPQPNPPQTHIGGNVGGDKVGGDKVGRDKITHIHQAAPAPDPTERLAAAPPSFLSPASSQANCIDRFYRDHRGRSEKQADPRAV